MVAEQNVICSLPLTGRAIRLGFHPHRQAGGVQPTVVYPVMGHHGPGGSKTFPGVAVGEDEILGAGGDGHPDAVAFPEAIGQLGGADLQQAGLLEEVLGQHHPGIDVQVVVLTSQETVSRLALGTLDVGLVALPMASV